MNRLEKVRKEIEKLHEASSDECMKMWFFEGHVEAVAKYVDEIARKVGANVEVSTLAALCHDIARTCNIEDEPALMGESLKITRHIMEKAGYKKTEIEAVKEAIVNHSCRKHLPKTEEGKVVATADALAHLMTDFYLVLPFYGWLKVAKDFEGYRKWLLEKIERDFKKKIFYEEYRNLARKRYEALKVLFTK